MYYVTYIKITNKNFMMCIIFTNKFPNILIPMFCVYNKLLYCPSFTKICGKYYNKRDLNFIFIYNNNCLIIQ